MGARDWYVPLAGDGPVRLFVFPHAGAGCARFVGLARGLAPDVAVWAANLPGRQARLDEPPRTDLSALVEELADHLAGLARPPYGLLGYCGGALLAYLVTRALRERGVPAPEVLIVVSFEAPDIARRPRGLVNQPSERLWEYLTTEGGAPADLATDERLRHVSEPAVRADFGMLASYRHQVAPPLPCRITVVFGRDDPTPRGAWLGWRRMTDAALELVPLPGDHWLLEASGDDLTKAVATVLGGGSR